MPSVSVIIPYYKKINYIKKTINSVLNQTFQDFEIILIYDDDILDDLITLENEYKKNPKIKIIKNSNNLGAGISRNIGIKHASGEIISFLDADDFWLPEKLNKQLKFMSENNYDFTFCNYEKKLSEKKNIKIVSLKKKIGYKDLIRSCDIGLSTVSIKKKILIDNLFPPLKTQEDYVAWLKITKKNSYAYNLPESLVIWNKSKNSLSSNFFQKIKDGFKVYNIYERYNLIKSLYCLFLLSFNSLKRKF